MQRTLQQIAEFVKGELSGDPERVILGIAPIEQATIEDISFADRGRNLKKVPQSKAAAVLVPSDADVSGPNLIRVANPRLAFARVAALFYSPSLPDKGCHSSVCTGRDCKLGQDIAIAPGVVMGNNVTIGDRVALYPNVVVGDDVIIGDDTVIYPNAAILERCRIGRRVIIHSGSVIGSDGFGFVPDENGHFQKIPQTGIVQIDDDVEIGANNTIDRATFGRTWIQAGVKTDNLVHIAHNVTIGKDSAIAGQVGFAGSSTIGSHVAIAGQAGVGGHLTVADGVTIGPQAAVAQSIVSPQTVSGTTLAMPHRTWLRLQRILPDLPRMQKDLRALQQALARLEDKIE